MNLVRFAHLRAVLTLAGLLLLALVSSCSVNPATGQRQFSLVSADQEAAMGREGYPAAIAEYGLYDDKALAAYVDGIGQRLARVSELPDLEWHFTVLDDPAVNAFAMPGGYIFITRGILAHLNTEAQLAGVMGHEIGHVTARHSAQQLTQQTIAGLGLGLAGVLSPTIARYSGAAQQAMGLMFLKYSRDHENQADALGIRYATAAGWDAREIPATYATLKRISERSGSSLPGYLSTHPDPGDREQRTAALAAQATAGKTGLLVHAHEYLDHVRGVVYGDDPRQGYFEAQTFYQPELGFEVGFPQGWKTQNTHSSVMAQEPQGQASLQLTLAADAAALSPQDYVAALRSNGRIADSEGRVETIGGWPAWTGRVQTPAANGAAGTVLFAAWIRTAPDRMFQFLGRTAASGDANEAKLLASVRSFRALQDSRRRNPVPDRLKIAPAAASATFTNAIAQLGANALNLEDTAILNGVESGASVSAGQWLKVVEPGRRR